MGKERETFNGHKVYLLSEIAYSLHRMVAQNYRQPYYIKAEIVKLNYYKKTGHCYPELVEKEGKDIKAEMRAVIWKQNFSNINERFLQIAGEPIKENISILCLAFIEYNPRRGLALHIQDIEPTYTLGEIMKNRNAVIARLKKEGVFTQNKSLVLPLLPKRIAVISVDSSKGYSDFIATLNGNHYGYCFSTTLFPSILQGERAVEGITACLTAIASRRGEFDCVTIVRGGGGDVGLNCYDDYRIAYCVATFPLPVLTGIGHSTNLSITDMVAHTNFITPTDVAFALIECFRRFDDKLQTCQIGLQKVNMLLQKNLSNLNLTAARIANLAQNRLQGAKDLLGLYAGKAASEPVRQLKRGIEILTMTEEKVHLLHPGNILKRGFSITRLNGKALTGNGTLKPGDVLDTQLYHGKVTSIVSEVHGDSKEQKTPEDQTGAQQSAAC